MKTLPIVICTSVIRSSKQGESHGGMYLVDLENEKFIQVVDWNDQTIDWQGRGADRGLRGIAFYKDKIIAAASDEIFFYDQQFKIIASYKNKYLKHCHEIFIENDKLYLSSTGYDSLLVFNLVNLHFEEAFFYRMETPSSSGIEIIDRVRKKLVNTKVTSYKYDPNSSEGPSLKDTCHINNIFRKDGHIHFSGRFLNRLMRINSDASFETAAILPKGTHNVQFFKEYLLMNNTDDEDVLVTSVKGTKIEHFDIVKYDESTLLHNNFSKDHARQAFGRGLCSYGDYIIAGSSPATISVFKIGDSNPIKSINLIMDIRNSIHGLEVYPFDASNLVKKEYNYNGEVHL